MPPKKYNRTHDFIQGIIDADLSDVSKRVYMERLKRLIEQLNTDIFTIISQPGKTLTWIRKTYTSPATQKSYISAVLGVFRHNKGLKEQKQRAYEEWYQAFKTTHEEIDAKYKRNEPNEKQIEGYVRFEDIVAKRDVLEEGSDERLLLSLYTFIPPLRCDFNAVRIVTTDEEHAKSNTENVLILNEKSKSATLKLHEFKTATVMSYEKELPSALVEEIMASLHKNPREYLFQDRSRKPYRASSFNKWANRTLLRLFGKNLTISLIRHSYINSLDFNKLTVEEKENIAKDMAHTVGTQDRYRLIFQS